MMFHKLTINNFRGFQNEKNVDFKYPGVTLLIGKNASGKTSILKGIKFALFGTKAQDGGVARPNFDTKQDATAELTFLGRDNKKYMAFTTYKPYGKNNTFELYYVNEEQLTDCSKTLEEVLAFDPRLLKDVLFIEEGEIYHFLSRKKKQFNTIIREHLSQVLQLNKFDDLHDKLVEALKSVKQDLTRYQKEIEELLEQDLGDEARNMLSQEISATTEKIDELKSQNLNINEWMDLSLKFEKINASLDETKEQLTQVRKTLEKHGTRDSSPNKILEELNKKRESKKKRLMDVKKEYQSKKQQYELNSLTLKLLEHAVKEDETSCPTCHQPLTKEHAQSIIKTISQTQTREKTQIERLQQEIKQLEDEERQLETQIQQMKEAMTLKPQLIEQLKSLQNEKEAIDTKLKAIGDPEHMENIQRELMELEKTLQELQDEYTLKQALHDRLQELPGIIDSLKYKQAFLSLLSESVEETRTKILMEFLVPIKEKLESLIKTLKGEEWSVKLDENVSPIISRSGATKTEIELEDLSGAEKTLVFLLYRWVLSKLLIGKHLLIMDDALNHLDDGNKKYFISLLLDLLQNQDEEYQLIIASFDEDLKNHLAPLSPKIIEL